MKLCLLTDSVPQLSFEAALDLAAGLGIESVEIASGGQSSAPHLRLDELLSSAAARASFADAIESRDLRLAALNCSAWPLHPVRGPEEARFIEDSIRLAGELGVEKIVTMSGCPGDSPQGTTINWIWFPWPPETRPILERQWEQAIELWQGLAEFARAHGVNRIAFELHPLHLAYNVPTLREAPRCGRADHRRQPRPEPPVLAADGPGAGRRSAGSGVVPRPPQGHSALGGRARGQRRSRPSAVGGPHEPAAGYSGPSGREPRRRAGPPF